MEMHARLPERLKVGLPSELLKRRPDLRQSEQTIRAAECLDDAFVVDNLVEIQRIHPFRVKSGKHLVHDNEQIELLTAVCCYCRCWDRTTPLHAT